MKKLRKSWDMLGRSIYVGERLTANLKALTLAGIAVAALSLALIVLDFLTHQTVMLAASIITFLAGAGCAYFAGVRKNRERAALIPTVFCGLVFTLYAVTGVGEGSAMLWAVLLPVGMCYFVSVKNGIVLSAYHTLMFAVLFYTPLREQMRLYYTDSFMQRFPLLYAALATLTGIAMFQYHRSVLSEMENEKRLREQRRIAEEANRAKSSFLANMSHEIRTPINAVLGMDEMILRESSEEAILAYAEDIRNAGRTLLSLINDILDFSKVEEGKMEIVPTQYDLSSVINDLVNMLQPRAEKKGLRFLVQVDADTPHLLYGDEIRIRQCALNLLTNAVKYTEKGAVTLAVGYEKSDGESISLRFRVTDTGIGMKPESMEKLFSPFTRLDINRNRAIEGTGLGISITGQLLALMGSKLEVESVYGQGSTFSFAVKQPVVEWGPIGSFEGRYALDEPRHTYRESFHAPDARLLAVDDTPVNLTVIRGLLKKTQVQVVTASSGPEALKIAAREPFDVLLIDHMMPEMDGIETLRELKKMPRCAKIPCVALTANAVSGAREMYLAAGFSDYLSKPVDSAKLEKLLLACLPPEKVRVQERAEPPVALPAWLSGLEELDTAAGLRYCAAAETLLETMAVYAGSAPAAADEIEAFWRAGDVENATIKVHALKSASRTIGAEGLAALAERLEHAGRAGDAQTLFGGMEELLTRCRALGAQLAPLCAPVPEPEDVPAPDISEVRLREAYDSLRASVADFDADGARAVLDDLKKYRVPEAERGRVDALERAVMEYEWDQAEALLSI
ncbi:MAG: response regulator [Oscillospiraceae bacterium]|nr:response regulator [Oscillospiraceae bacterium]